MPQTQLWCGGDFATWDHRITTFPGACTSHARRAVHMTLSYRLAMPDSPRLRELHPAYSICNLKSLASAGPAVKLYLRFWSSVMLANQHVQVVACWSGAGLYALGLGWAHLKRAAGSGMLASLGSSERLTMVHTVLCSSQSCLQACHTAL